MSDLTKSYISSISKSNLVECPPETYRRVVSEQSNKDFNVFNKDAYPVRKTTITKIKYVQK